MKQQELKALLGKIREARIGILGDFCLDVYLLLDSSASEASLETGLSTRPIRSQRYSLGGAGNVASNLHAMGVSALSIFGVVGHDPFGAEMRRILISGGAEVDGLLVQREHWDTHVYMKPYEREQEQHRLDFGNFNQLQAETARDLLERLSNTLPRLDIVIINQQVLRGIHTREFREDLRALIAAHPDTPFIVDSRHHTDDYGPAIRKLNVREGARLFGHEETAPELLESGEIEKLARDLYQRWGRPLFLTRGEQGCIVVDQEGSKEIPGLLILSPVDTVGAGDSVLAGIASALAVGAPPPVAAELGSLAAGVTVQKLMQTGTASPEEILNIGSDPDYRYHPDLARQLRKAVYHEGTDIEIVSALRRQSRFTHAIFDHDGTISTLRQGWEEIMEPMMLRAILGRSEREVDESFYNHVLASVRDYIDKTTGIQTLAQMKGLVNMVRQFKCVPEEEILDEFGYKELYNEELLRMVRKRIRKLEEGELSVEDFTIKNVMDFLRALHEKGMMLYLASGTDQEDVEREAEVLGCRAFFADRIYGAVGSVTKEAKRIVLERILSDIGQRQPERIITFGDGPVEIRETHKNGGYTVGVASNEIRRYGLNPSKRKRLIEAGADLIIPDYCQMKCLLELLPFGTPPAG
jgi:rfaE bifunctional protein kinase chain/domain